LGCGGAGGGGWRLAATCEALDASPPPAAHGAPALAFEGPRPRNLLLLSLDTLRRDRVGRYGGGGGTPFLDGLLADGVALDDHRACSNWTLDAMSCALSGRYAWELGFMPSAGGDLTGEGGRSRLPEGVTLLSDWLDQAGYDTALVSANPFLSDAYGMVGGYDTFTGLLVDGPALVSELLAALEGFPGGGAGGAPWMLHLHLIEPHAPWSPPPRYTAGLDSLAPIDWDPSTWGGVAALEEALPEMSEAERALVLEHIDRRYGGEVAWMDHTLEVLFTALEARGALADTLVAVLSDHGEQLFEHGELQHGRGLYEEETAALAGFWSQGMIPAAWAGPTAHIDLAPTILEALGLEAPVALSGSVAGAADPARPRYAQCLKLGDTHASVDVGGDRLIFSWDDGSLERYDRAADPLDLVDLHAPGDPTSQALWREHLSPYVEAIHCALGGGYPPAPPDL